MPKTITKTVFTFKELLDSGNQRAIEKAREWLQVGATDHDWWGDVYEMWKEALSLIGLTNVDIAFSGFASQGDGASFTANVDPNELIRFMALGEFTFNDNEQGPWLQSNIGYTPDPKYKPLLTCGITARVIRTSSHYAHENTCQFECEFEPPEDTSVLAFAPFPSYLEQLYEECWAPDAEQLRLNLCRAIYKSLEEEYEYRTSDEALIEDADANDWTFDEYGDRDG